MCTFASHFTAAVLSAAAIVTLAGCSSTAKPTGGHVDSTFLAKATSACDGSLQQVAPYPFPYSSFDAGNPAITELPGAGAYYDAQPFNHKELGFITSLGEPKQGGRTWARFVDLVRQQQAAVGREISTAKKSDKAGFVSAVTDIEALGAQFRAVGAEVGFSSTSSCLKLFS